MKLTLKVRIYIYFTILLSIAVMVIIYFQNPTQDISWIDLVFWSILAVLTESLVVRLPDGMGLSVGLAISLAALLANGPFVATIATGIGFLFRVIPSKSEKKIAHIFNTNPHKTFFNTAQGILSIGIAGIFYSLLGGETGNFNILLIFQVVLFYTLLNSSIMALFFSLLQNRKFTNTWLESLKGIIVSIVLVGFMGVILFLAYKAYGIGAVMLFLAPLLLARFSFQQYSDLRETYIETIRAFSSLTEAKDPYTGEHAARVETYAVELAKYIGFSSQRVHKVRLAAILHDIGKIGISDNILRKPKKLTDEEFDLIRAHPEIGAEVIKDVKFLKEISRIIRQHHERYDGKGYNEKLKGDEICDEAYIIALADTYDAITSNRSYRQPLSFEEAQEEIKRNIGTQFSPDLGGKFLELIKLKPEVFNRDAV